MSIRNPVKADIDIRNAFDDVILEFSKLKRELNELRQRSAAQFAQAESESETTTNSGALVHGSLTGLSERDHPATAITNTPAGTIAATTVQAAIDELDTEKVAKAGDTMTGSLTGPGYVSITGAADASGNIRFSAANPYIVASSYITMPGGLYVSGGTLYVTNEIQARGGVDSDATTYLSIGGGTGGGTHASATAGAPLSYAPGVYVIAKPVHIQWRSNSDSAAITGYDLGYAVKWTTATTTYENESTFALVTRGGLANAAIQVKKAGVYHITVQLLYSLTTGAQGYMYLLRLNSSGTRIQYLNMWSDINASAGTITLTTNTAGTYYLDANDELLTNVYHNTGGDSNWAVLTITRVN